MMITISGRSLFIPRGGTVEINWDELGTHACVYDGDEFIESEHFAPGRLACKSAPVTDAYQAWVDRCNRP